MSRDRWYPISPKRTSSGAFQAFADLPDGGRYRPVNLAAHQQPFQSTFLEEASFQLTLAMKLGVVGLGEASVAFALRTYTFEAFLYTESPQVGRGEDSPILATRWGAGVRVTVTTREVEGGAQPSLKAVAARVELGQAEASFEIKSVGIRDRRVMGILPGPGRFDLQAFAELQQAGDRALQHMGANRGYLDSVPFQVLLSRPPESDLEDHRSVLLAMQRLSKRDPLQEARSEARRLGLDERVVARTYRSIVGGRDRDDKPSLAEAREARQWLRSTR